MTSGFYTSESIVLERQIETDGENISVEDIWGENQRTYCINWVKENAHKKICLQFPDGYLKHSVKICDDLKMACDAKFFILGDTSYGSCCVDEIAAAHVEADALIHFGNACRSKVSRLPVFYVFPHFPFEPEDFLSKLDEIFISIKGQRISIFLDIPYQYLLDEEYKDISDKVRQKSQCSNLSIECFPVEEGSSFREIGDVGLFVGCDGQAFFNISMSLKVSKWYMYNPAERTMKEVNPLTANWIRRRYYYIEKCKDAQTLGLIVATLTTTGYLEAVKHIQEMARSRGIRTHIISVGRLYPAKLANFMEIDCFVLIGCPFNNLYTSREFYKPIVSVFEAEIALNPAWYMKMPEMYVTDFKEILEKGQFYNEFRADKIEGNDVSLITGRMRGAQIDNIGNDGNNKTLAERKNYQLMETNSGVTYESRSWKGLEANLGLNEPAKIEKGLSGIPISYKHE